MMGFVTGVAAVSSARRAPSAMCTRSSFAGAAVVAAPVARATVRMSNIQESIQTEIAKAKEASEKYGKTSKEAAAAWDAVEELEAEASHQKNAEKKDPLEEYCEDVPEADECRTYED